MMSPLTGPRRRFLPGQETPGFARTGWERAIHLRLIEASANHLSAKGYSVEADHLEGGVRSPGPINGFVPDVVGRRGSEAVYVEVETCSSLSCSLTHRQLKALSDRPDGPTWVVVPHEDLDKLVDLRRKLRLAFRAVPGFPYHKSLGDPR